MKGCVWWPFWWFRCRFFEMFRFFVCVVARMSIFAQRIAVQRLLERDTRPDGENVASCCRFVRCCEIGLNRWVLDDFCMVIDV